MNDLELTNTGVFKAIGTPHLPPGPLMVAEAAASAQMLEQDRELPPKFGVLSQVDQDGKPVSWPEFVRRVIRTVEASEKKP